MSKRIEDTSSFEAVMNIFREQNSTLYFVSLIRNLLDRQVCVSNIWHECSPEEWQMVSDALEAINTETSLRIKRSIDYRLRHTK